MQFFDEKSGALALGRGCSLSARMTEEAVLENRAHLGKSDVQPKRGGMVPFPSIKAGKGRIAPLAIVEGGVLRAVHLWTAATKGRPPQTAHQQRAFLFSLLGCKDPCPDTLKSCHVACEFGSMTLSSDPRTGCALARITYR